MTEKLRPASSFSAFAQEAARAAVAECAIFAPAIRRRLALENQLLVDEEPGYTPDPEPPTVKRTQKPGPKAEPKATRRYNKKGPRK